MSDGTIDGADPSPLLTIPVVVMQHNPNYAKVILSCRLVDAGTLNNFLTRNYFHMLTQFCG